MTSTRAPHSRARRRLAALATAALAALAVVPSMAAADEAAAPSGEPLPTLLELEELGGGDAGVLPTQLPAIGDSDGIGPGSLLVITRADGTFVCTANFIWQSGSTKYLGTAGHCLQPSPSRIRVCVAGCTFGGVVRSLNDIVGTVVELCNGNCSIPVAADGGVGNDFGLIRIPATPPAPLRYEIPMFGGPSGTTALGLGDRACLYGNGAGTGEVFLTKGRPMVGTSSSTHSWGAHGVTNLGDSGAPVVTCTTSGTDVVGQAAVGIQTHGGCVVAGVPAASCGTRVDRAKAIAAAAGLSITIVEP